MSATRARPARARLPRARPHRAAPRSARTLLSRASVTLVNDEQWARLPAAFRQKTLARSFAENLDAAARASRQGGFDGPETHVSRVVLAVDEAGRAEITALLAETREAALQIHAASASRQAEQHSAAPPPIATELALIHVRHAKTS
jgi:hypothetical protein